MSFDELLGTLRPANSHQSQRLLQTLKTNANNAELFWYPGSGRDLTPLLLDVPNNPAGVRLFRTEGEAGLNGQRPRILWMNDYPSRSTGFPDNEPRAVQYQPEYRTIWNLYRGIGSIVAEQEMYEAECGITLKLFLVTIQNFGQGLHSRPSAGDTYLVIYTPAESEQLMKRVFIKFRIRVATVALIKQGGLSGQRRDFWQYMHLPRMLLAQSDAVGPLDFCCIDKYGQEDHEPEPFEKSLKSYRYAGGPIDWGWCPCRIFARDGVPYHCEFRPRPG